MDPSIEESEGGQIEEIPSLPIGKLSVKNEQMIEYVNYPADGVNIYYKDAEVVFAACPLWSLTPFALSPVLPM